MNYQRKLKIIVPLVVNIVRVSPMEKWSWCACEVWRVAWLIDPLLPLNRLSEVVVITYE